MLPDEPVSVGGVAVAGQVHGGGVRQVVGVVRHLAVATWPHLGGGVHQARLPRPGPLRLHQRAAVLLLAAVAGPALHHTLAHYTDDGIFYLWLLFAQIKKINSGYFLNKITMLVLTATIS